MIINTVTVNVTVYIPLYCFFFIVYSRSLEEIWKGDSLITLYFSWIGLVLHPEINNLPCETV